MILFLPFEYFGGISRNTATDYSVPYSGQKCKTLFIVTVHESLSEHTRRVAYHDKRRRIGAADDLAQRVLLLLCDDAHHHVPLLTRMPADPAEQRCSAIEGA